MILADNCNKSCQQIETLESVSHTIFYMALLPNKDTLYPHGGSDTVWLSVSEINLQANMPPIIHYSLLITGCLCARLHVLPLSCLSSTSFLLSLSLAQCLPLFRSAYFKGLFTMCHTGSWAPLNKGGSGPLWGLRNKRVRGVPRERPPHFSDRHTLPENSLFPRRRQW